MRILLAAALAAAALAPSVAAAEAVCNPVVDMRGNAVLDSRGNAVVHAGSHACPAADGTAASDPAKRAVPAKTVVFFAFDSARLSAEASAAVGAVAKQASERPVRIDVVGHTDTSGPERYNDRLSLRRADAVRAALVGAGVAPDAVTAAGRGEREPVNPTGDGVRDPANRRAEILVSPR